MTIPPLPPPSGGQHATTRRTVLRTAAWSVPAVSLATAAPAFASSTAPELTPGASTPIDVTQCVPVDSVTFIATIGNAPAPVGETVTVTLPTGLAFVGGGTSVAVAVSAGGLVQVPEFVANGAAGTYSVTATLGSATASQTISVTPAPGSVVQLDRQAADRNTTAAFRTTTVAVPDAVSGAVWGDQVASGGYSTGSNAAILTATGTVRFWGANVGATTGAPATLTHNSATVTGLTMVDTWTSTGLNTNTAGGVAASPSAVYSWHRDGTGTGAAHVAQVTGLSGTVLAVAAEDGVSYALTTNGVYHWVNPTSGTTVAARGPISGTAGATELSTWSHRGPANTTLRAGGAVLVGNTVRQWTVSNNNVNTPTSSTPAVDGSITKMIHTDSGTMVRSSSGELWSYGAGFGGDTWVRRVESGVADFSMWGYINYVGGLYQDTTGGVSQFFGARNWYTPVTVRTGNVTNGTAVSNITKTFSADGTYLMLRADGTVYAWGGNLDNNGRGPAVAIGTGTGTTVDLNVWGKHISGIYTGGGYVIKGSIAC